MPYNKPVKFTTTGQYGCGPEDEDDVYTVKEFLALCEGGMFIDYDGFGHPVKDSLSDESICVCPSDATQTIPKNATHVVWFNR